ncbi:MAG: hypothetical protein JWM47_1851, partial [Acidimicrobiales bacterium]|nr:hypothetical protein [Acidimicrobiales bacterium]
AGVNFGWIGYEWSNDLFPDRVPAKSHAPIMEMLHAERWCAAIGGVVYRGTQLPELEGSYLFGDLCKDHLYAIDQVDGRVTRQRILTPDLHYLIAIEQDRQGEIWILTYEQGLLRLVPKA